MHLRVPSSVPIFSFELKPAFVVIVVFTNRQTTCCYIVSTLLWAVRTRPLEQAFDVHMTRPPHLIPLADWWRQCREGGL